MYIPAANVATAAVTAKAVGAMAAKAVFNTVNDEAAVADAEADDAIPVAVVAAEALTEDRAEPAVEAVEEIPANLDKSLPAPVTIVPKPLPRVPTVVTNLPNTTNRVPPTAAIAPNLTMLT